MTQLVPASAPASRCSPVVPRLASLCHGRGLPHLSARLERLGVLLAADLGDVERDLAALPRRGSVVRQSAAMLIDAGGKRLRPVCVALAARLGSGFDARARQLAVAVELVHNATLLHDDVVDLGDQRRGLATARTVFGNASSIFAGDWLLVEALRRVRATGFDDMVGSLLDAIEEMIAAEAEQLASRGRIVADRGAWLRIVDGKTAALFRWALVAGARAGGVGTDGRDALVAFGTQLGIAFQAVDDMLDLTGDSRTTGKACLADLSEGRLTLPLILAVDREPALLGMLQDLLNGPDDPDVLAARRRAVVDAASRAEATQECLAFATRCADRALEALRVFPPGEVRDAFEAVAMATVSRRA